MSEQENRDILERYGQEFFERQNIDAIDDLMHDAYVEEYPSRARGFAAWTTRGPAMKTIQACRTLNTIAGVLPFAVWVVLRAVLGLYPGYGLYAVDELRRQSYATLGALIITSTFLGLHQGQDVSRSVHIDGFLVLLIVAPLVRQLVKWTLKKARLCGSWMTTDNR